MADRGVRASPSKQAQRRQWFAQLDAGLVCETGRPLVSHLAAGTRGEMVSHQLCEQEVMEPKRR